MIILWSFQKKYLKMEVQDVDLPLSANFKQFRIEHYNLDMTCNFEQHTFDSTVLLSITSGPEWKGETDLVLDCSDIEVQDVRTRDSENEKRLEFSMTKWAITVFLPASEKERLGVGQVISLIITYRTVPKSRSLHWRQNCDGSICVYTAAASINNRGLFPCQVTAGGFRQELKESQSPFVRMFGSSLSRAVNLHLSRSESNQSN